MGPSWMYNLRGIFVESAFLVPKKVRMMIHRLFITLLQQSSAHRKLHRKATVISAKNDWKCTVFYTFLFVATMP